MVSAIVVLLAASSVGVSAFRGHSHLLKRSSCGVSIQMAGQCDNQPELSSGILRADAARIIKIIGAGIVPFAAAAISARADFNQDQRPDMYEDKAQVLSGIKPDYAAIREDIKALIEAKPDKGPTLVRLSWHSSGTYDKMSKTGGSGGGTIRFKEELAHGANAGLDMAVSWLDPIYNKYNKKTDLSYADLYTLAGVVAIQTLGGPKVPWRAGRMDTLDPKDPVRGVTPDGRLPAADKGSPEATAEALRTVFGRMGFNDQEIVALSGAHALGRCHVTASGYVGPWTFTPLVFDNAYFKVLVNVPWTPNPKSPKFQYQDPSGKAMMLPSDLVLIQDAAFKSYTELYAKDLKRFYSDFSAAFSKLLELGTSNLYAV